MPAAGMDQDPDASMHGIDAPDMCSTSKHCKGALACTEQLIMGGAMVCFLRT